MFRLQVNSSALMSINTSSPISPLRRRLPATDTAMDTNQQQALKILNPFEDTRSHMELSSKLIRKMIDDDQWNSNLALLGDELTKMRDYLGTLMIWVYQLVDPWEGDETPAGQNQIRCRGLHKYLTSVILRIGIFVSLCSAAVKDEDQRVKLGQPRPGVHATLKKEVCELIRASEPHIKLWEQNADNAYRQDLGDATKTLDDWVFDYLLEMILAMASDFSRFWLFFLNIAQRAPPDTGLPAS